MHAPEPLRLDLVRDCNASRFGDELQRAAFDKLARVRGQKALGPVDPYEWSVPGRHFVDARKLTRRAFEVEAAGDRVRRRRTEGDAWS